MRSSIQNRLLCAVALIAIMADAGVINAQSSSFDPNQAAGQLSDQVKAKFGTADGIRQNAVNPLTTDASQLTNISGTTSFNAPLVFCPASKKFLDVTIVPGDTGDISGIYVLQDTDFDGALDYAYTVPVPASGICGNGVISCDPGTWNNCKYYKWVADSFGKIGLLQGSMQDLGGCFCINNSCGNNLVTAEMSYVLTMLGGGAAGAIQAVNPKWAVSNVSTVDTTISYYGQKSDQCTTYTAGSSGPANPEQFYTQSADTLESASQTEKSNQMSISSSYYYHLGSSLAAQNNASEYRTCTVQDLASVNTDKQSPSYQWQPWLDLNMYCYWSEGPIMLVSYTADIDTNNDGLYDKTESWSEYWPPIGSGPYTTTHPAALATLTAKYQQTYNVSSSEIQVQSSSNWVFGFIDGGGKGNGGNQTWLYNYLVDKISPPICPTGYTLNTTDIMCYLDTLSDSVIDNCSELENNSACKLQGETVDGVATYSNFNPTGLTPPSSCITLTGAMQTFNVCHDWWTKERTYLCTTSAAYDLSAIKERTKNISNTVTTGSSSFSYQDKTPDASGEWTYSSNTVAVDTTGGSSTCMTSCKTRKPATNTQASLTGTTAQSNVSTSSWEYFYKTCSGATCPVGSDEEVLIDCQCINEFGEAAAVMEAMDEAGKDLICSDGTKQ